MKEIKGPAFVQQIWNWLVSMRVALFLLLVIAGLSVFGTIIPQGEDRFYYQQVYGPLRANLISLFQMDDVFHSWWFLGLAFWLAASLLACSLNRLKPLWRQATTFQYYYEDDFYTSLPR